MTNKQQFKRIPDEELKAIRGSLELLEQNFLTRDFLRTIDALEHAYAEIERLRQIRYNATEAHATIQTRLVEENQRLREALERIAYIDENTNPHANQTIANIAKQALKGDSTL
jgi:hypothetical protein